MALQQSQSGYRETKYILRGSSKLLLVRRGKGTFGSSTCQGKDLLTPYSSPVNLTAPIEYFETVQQAVNDHFNRSVQISVITFPIEMISRAAKVSVADAFLDIKFLAPRDDLLYLFESKSAIQYAYNLNTCHGLGLADDCDSEMDDHIAVLLEYDSAKLAISLISMHDEGCQTRAYLSLPSLGESGRLSSVVHNDPLPFQKANLLVSSPRMMKRS